MNHKNKTKTKTKTNSNLERYAGYSYKSPDPSELPMPSFLLQLPQYYNQKMTSLNFLIEDMKKNQEKN
jgi:hypothetical protein